MTDLALSSMAAPSAIAPAIRLPRRRLGVFRGGWRRVFGDPEDASARRLRKMGEAHAWLFRASRLIAALLIFAFTAAGVYTMANGALTRSIAAIAAGSMPSPSDISEVVILILMGIGFDFVVILGTLQLREALLDGERLRDHLALLGFIGVICAIEGATYFLMIQTNEHPTGLWLILAIARALAIPICAIVLSIAEKRALSRAAFRAIVARDISAVFIEELHRSIAEGKADLRSLLAILQLVQPGTPEQKRQDMELLDRIGLLLPDGAGEQSRLALDHLKDALMHFLAHGEWPQELVTQLPILEGLSGAEIASRFGVSEPKARRIAGPKAPTSRADAERLILSELGILPATPPMIGEGKEAKRAKGVWIGSPDLSALTGGKIAGDAARDQMSKIARSQKSGRTIVAPFRAVMGELAQRHLLSDAAGSRWTSYLQRWADEEANPEESEPAIRLVA